MYIPDKVKVGHMLYDVAIVSEPIILNNRQCTGMIDYEKGKIKLCDSSIQGDHARFQTFWHELFHAFVRDKSLKLDDEELVVDELGKALAAFFIDNGIEFPKGE